MPSLSGRQFVLAALSGGVLALSFPLPHWSTLAWIALVPLITTASHASLRGAWWLGWIAGVTFFTTALHWVTNTMTNYGHLPLWLSYLLLVLLASYLGVYVGLFALGARVLNERPAWVRLLALSALWTALEVVRASALTGFPWATLGYSQATTLPVIQIADTVGVYGISFIIVFVNVAVAQALTALLPSAPMTLPIPVTSFVPLAGAPFPHRAFFGPLLAVVAVLNAILVYGHWRLDELDRTTTEHPLVVTVVQGNIDQMEKWDPARLPDILGQYQRLTRDRTSPRPDLVVWPEAAMPFFFEREPVYNENVTAFVAREHIALLFGSPALEASAGRPPRLYNSAYLLAPDGTVAGRYDKLHLVPFGEYVPLASLLFFVDKLVDGIGDFSPGTHPVLFTVNRARLGVMICFEVIFPDLTRRMVSNGATVMVTITNDAWFGKSAAPYQHLEMVALRAVENRIPFARAANTGVSGFIDASGRIFNTSDLFTEATSTATLTPRTTTTFYTRYGDVFAWLCLLATLGVFGWELVRARSR